MNINLPQIPLFNIAAEPAPLFADDNRSDISDRDEADFLSNLISTEVHNSAEDTNFRGTAAANVDQFLPMNSSSNSGISLNSSSAVMPEDHPHSRISLRDGYSSIGDRNSFTIRASFKEPDPESWLNPVSLSARLSKLLRFLKEPVANLDMHIEIKDEAGQVRFATKGQTEEDGFYEKTVANHDLEPGKYTVHYYSDSVQSCDDEFHSLTTCELGQSALTILEDNKGQMTFIDIDETLIKTDYHTLEEALKTLTRSPGEILFSDGMDLLASVLDTRGSLTAVSSSPDEFREDISEVAGRGQFSFEGGIALKRWREHFPLITETYGYKVSSILERLQHLPQGSKVDFIGDDTQRDPEVYVTVQKLLKGELSPAALAERISNRSWNYYGKDETQALAQKVLDKDFDYGTTIIRLTRDSQNKIADAFRSDVIAVRNGLQAAMYLRDEGRINDAELLQIMDGTLERYDFDKEKVKKSINDITTAGVSQETKNVLLQALAA